MEQTQSAAELLNLMVRPAFAVKDGEIIVVNEAARKYALEPGMKVHDFLLTGGLEYAEMTGGCLYLTLCLSGLPRGAAVNRMTSFDVFTLEQTSDQAELQALALAAQELRTPLSNVMAVADQLFPVTDAGGDPMTHDQIAHINRGLFQVLRIVGNMADAYRYSQHTEAQMALVDIRSMAQEFFDKSGQLLRHAGITLHFTNLRKPVVCLADVEKLERGIHNILSNAVKFTQPGGEIYVRLTQRQKMLFLTVEDQGSGIRKEMLGSIHTRFLREPGVEDGRYGIGLGFVLIRSAAAAHGGTVLIDQPADGGVRLTMSMAIRQDTEPTVHTRILHVDYAGERDHSLIELSDILPASEFTSEKIN